MNTLQTKLAEDFSDAEYADEYMASHTITKLAAQIYWTRNMRKLTQQQLAEKAGMKQERVSKIEAGDFTSVTTKTLRKFARALDVNLRIEFEPFSHAIHCATQKDDKASLALPSRMDSIAAMKHETMVARGMFGAPHVFIHKGAYSQAVTNPTPIVLDDFSIDLAKNFTTTSTFTPAIAP